MDKKFKSLTHNGPVFPEEYTPNGYCLNNQKLSPLAEEMLYHYSAKKETDYVKDTTFNKNFYSCLKNELTESQQKLKFPEDYQKLITTIYNDIQKEKEVKAKYRKDNKDDIELAKAKMKEQYGYAILDGEKQPLGAYLIEGPGIMMARGKSPVLGLWKYRTQPEDVIINFVSKTEKPPVPPKGHKWGKVISDTNAFHTVAYKVNVGNKKFTNKEIRFANDSTVKAEADQHKFAKAAKLLQHLSEMEIHIEKGLKDKDPKRRECALISWLIENTGIRIGNTKNLETEADTVGASTLKRNNIWYDKGNIHLDFIGKDSVPYQNTIKAPLYVGNAIEKLRKSKDETEQVFSVNATDVGNFLSECVEGVSPKVWRTAIASKLFIDAFKNLKVKKSMSVREKLNAIDLANLEVAKKLNHQRTISKTFDEQNAKLDEQIQQAKDSAKEGIQKAKDDIKNISSQMEHAKQIWEGTRLKEKLKKLKDKKTKAQEKIAKLEERVNALIAKKELKNQTKNYAISTSRTNYITPEIGYSICEDFDIPIEKFYTKTLQAKYSWVKANKDYWKKYPNV